MDSYTLHLAMAALVGASFVAVSAYCMHRKTLNQLLEFARAVERERERDKDRDRNREGEYDCSELAESPRRQRRGGVRRKRVADTYRRASDSLSDVMVMSGMAAEVDDSRCNGEAMDWIPEGLPRLHSLTKGNDCDLHR